jgi:hypothetical protein
MGEWIFTDSETQEKYKVKGDNYEGAKSAFEQSISTQEPNVEEPFVPQFLGDVPPSMSPPMGGPPVTYGQAIGDATLGNASTILGVAGSFGGSPIIGGAAGSALGGAVEEAWNGTSDIFERAATEGVISVAFDKLMQIIPKPVRYSILAAKKALGMNAKEAAESIAKELEGKAAEFGTDSAKLQAQAIANEAGASLTPFNLGKDLVDSGHVGEKIGRMGFFNDSVYLKNLDKIGTRVNERLNNIFTTKGVSVGEIGRGWTDALQQGRTSRNEMYGEQLLELSGKLRGNTISSDPLIKGIANFKKFGNKKPNPNDRTRSFTTESKQLDLTQATQDVMKELETFAGKPGLKMTGAFLLKFDAKITNLISEARHSSPNGLSTSTDRELKLLSDYMKGVVTGQLKKVDKSVARDYIKLKRGHASSMNTMFPDLNKSFIKAGNKESFDEIGKMFQGTNTDTITNSLKSLKESYANIPKGDLKNLTFPTEEAALVAIRESYAANTLKSFNVGMDSTAFTRAALEMNNKDQRPRIKAIMGEHFESYRKAVNTFAEASKNPSSGISLVMRGEEAGAVRRVAGNIGAIATGAGAGAAAAGSALTALPAAIIGGGVVLLTPWLLAKSSVNPKRLNRLIQLKNTDFSNYAKPEKIERTLKILNEFVDTEEESKLLMEWANSVLGTRDD